MVAIGDVYQYRKVRKMMEKDLFEWLTARNYECFYNFPLGDKFPDMIAIKGKELIAFELKSHAKEITTAMGQCLFYLNDANKVYIVIPAKEKNLLSSSVIETLKENGIGLMLNNGSIKILVEAKEFYKNCTSIIEEVRKKRPNAEKAKRKDVKKLIEETLKEHPEGLTTTEIAKYIDMTRQAVIKYIYQLLGEGTIFQREMGTAKVCYLKGKKHDRK